MIALMMAALCMAGAPVDRHGPWISLFDRRSLDGWTNAEGKPVGRGWTVEDGCIRRVASGAMDIFTVRTFGDFELELDWRLQPASNSGVKYRLHRMPDGRWLGPEYQIMDDPSPPGPPHKGSCASLYSLKEPRADVRQKAPGQWNRTRIVADGRRIEHWLNGKKVVEIVQDTPEWDDRLAKSKFAEHEGCAQWFARGASPIMLQDHGGSVWFRRIRIREIIGRD